MNTETASAINTLGHFCGMREVERLDREALAERFGLDQADVVVLFGGSIVAGGDVLADAIRDRIARSFILVGGAGHTTETLRQTVHREYPEIRTEGLPEAEIFQQYLKHVHGCGADYLETESTNCGNNITCLLELIRRNRIPCRSIILCQDATMQRRMDAGFRRYAPEGVTVINYASYQAKVEAAGETLVYANPIHGMWAVNRYVQLLMGEIPRLTDDGNGYGPKGRGFIAHVDIPGGVLDAFRALKSVYGEATRPANPRYASGRT